jgi:FAD/FMN-containing dehydrogenase
MTSTDLHRVFSGPVHKPGDADYDTQRAALNPALDARPVLVAEATSPADVRAAVTWARVNDVPLAVQSSGHGTHVASHGGLLVRTSRMATVLVDPDRRVAKIGAGATWGDVVAAAARFGLIPLSGTSPVVGVAGYTFGGGFGLLSRTFGLAADSLVRADLVTADGESVTATRDRNADLFWAVRGGGGNFGVATSIEVRLYPVTDVYAGVTRFPVERAAHTLAYYGEWAATEPNELTTAILLDQSDTFGIKAMYVGDAEDAQRALRPLWNVAGTPVAGGLERTRYADLSLPSVAPRNFDLYRSVSGPVAGELADLVARHDSVTGVEVKHWGGAIATATDAGPAAHRDVPFTVAVNGPADALTGVRRHSTGGSFLNFLHDPSAVENAYTPDNHRRLRAVKRTWDPDNFFHTNLNITPAHHAAELAAAH